MKEPLETERHFILGTSFRKLSENEKLRDPITPLAERHPISGRWKGSDRQNNDVVTDCRFMLQQRATRDFVGVLGDVFRVMLFDHCDAGVVQRCHQSDRHVFQQHAHDRRMPERVHRRVGIEPMAVTIFLTSRW